ncbi:methyltransferase domain-containing protein [Paraflavitalea pollutisoli]|uniref:methyltransferase domain-containing protein n=1 Tax=Paraflavitalea pollutisoli TaxID=3034143 RepID=UPI0023EC6E42|nr:methyltransferase domain-containing protein [Paraflavitalea sp. H1-2-19X]
MPWDPVKYGHFKRERSAPFFDALQLVQDVKPGLSVIDLGCGTGELTRHLADRLPDATVVGVDNSAEMLQEAGTFTRDGLSFVVRSIQDQLALPGQWDLIFSNAALQWVPDHEWLFPAVIDKIKPGGQLVVQMPAQHHNIANRLLLQTAASAPYEQALKGFKRTSPVLDTDRYAQLLFRHGGTNITALEKIYPLIVEETEEVFNFVAATGMIPYMEALPEELKAPFVADFKARIAAYFPDRPIFYPFRRILLSARF